MTMNANTRWWQTAVIYQIYPRSFMDSNGDGVGDLKGIINRLPYLSETLGVDAIWISPFFPSPMKDFGYDVSDFVDVDPLFGTLADAEQLIEEIHHRGMHVIFDFVSNHTSDQHAWFVESRASKGSPKRDWYIWRDPAPDGGPPNNWLSVFGGPAWTLDQETGQYYLHSFLSSQPDVNWRNPELREAMHGVLKFWIDRGVDGFRIDAAHFVGKDEELRDNPPAPPGSQFLHRSMGEYDGQIHLYDKGTDLSHEVYQDIRDTVDHYAGESREILLIGEIHVFDWAEWASYFGPSLNEFHLPYNFGLLGVDWNAREIAALVRQIEDALPDGAWPNWVFGNHDEPRVSSRLGDQQARSAMVLLLTLRGTPTIYYGDELGFVDADVPPELRQDPWGLQVTSIDASRDPQRSPMLWSVADHGGFTAPDKQPWLPVVDPETYCVDAQSDDPGSMLNLTRRLLELRRARPSLNAGDIELLGGFPDDCLVFLRQHGEEKTLIAISFSEAEVALDLGEAHRGTEILTSTIREPAVGEVEKIELGPYEAIVLDITQGNADR